MASRPDALDRLRTAEAAVRRLPAVLADALGRLERAARDDSAGELAALVDADGLVVLDRGRPAALLLADDTRGYLLAAVPLEASTAELDHESTPGIGRADRVLTFIRSRSGSTTAADIADGVPGVDVDQARVYLSRLCRDGWIERVSRGEYIPARSDRNGRNRGPVSSVSSQVGSPDDRPASSARQRTPPPSRGPIAAVIGEPDWPQLAEDLAGELDADGAPTAWPFIVHSHAALTCETPECGRPVRRRAYRGAPVHCGYCWRATVASALPAGQSEASSDLEGRDA